MYTALATTIYP